MLLSPRMRLIKNGALHLYVEWSFFLLKLKTIFFLIPKDLEGWYFKNNSSHLNLRPWKESSSYDPNLFPGPEPKAFSLAGEWIPFHSFRALLLCSVCSETSYQVSMAVLPLTICLLPLDDLFQLHYCHLKVALGLYWHLRGLQKERWVSPTGFGLFH